MAVYVKIDGKLVLQSPDGTKEEQLKALQQKLKEENKEIPSCFEALKEQAIEKPVVEIPTIEQVVEIKPETFHGSLSLS